ncbi:MAG TPA: hypothetical protein VFE96_00360 [Candidatus Bathyarchaeia archaeon]|nr:hypothetical protein [Candidatus Bathyarchaeia archaeon]
MASNTPRDSRSSGRSAVTKTLAFGLFLLAVFVSGWMIAKFSSYASAQGYLREEFQLGLSSLQIQMAIAGFFGLLLPLVIQFRRRSKRMRARPLKMTSMTFGTTKPAHPLMTTLRPSRDSKFVVRKTRNRGRISRNRMGERLPPSNATEADFE